MSSTFDQVRELMAREFQLEPDAILPDTPLIELGVDSLAALEFAFDLEEAFSITLDPRSDLRDARVADVVRAVEAALSESHAQSAAG
jgi:acyl carrier protein